MTGSIGVIGAGAWGTALAQMLAADGRAVKLWAYESDLVDSINATHENALFLAGLALSHSIAATSNLSDLAASDILLVVTPAQHMRGILAALPASSADLVLCSKGIEAGTGRFMVDIVRDTRPDSTVAILSGPTFAHEVAKGQPTAVTLACESGAQWQRLAPALARPHFRPYYSSDIIGAEIGGAVKNVLAIACGVVDGMGLGQNARASLISRGFAEMVRFGLACGAQVETLSGLSGLGDLVLTCSSTQSRNFSLGRAIGAGRSAAMAMQDKTSVAEGAFTAPVLLESAQQRGVNMPIVAAVCALLDESCTATQMVERLLARPLTAE